jgi:hypothetical protein
MKKLLACIFLFCFLKDLAAQSDSTCSVSISLLTCTPGQELYSTFGHSALRITDSTTNTDIIYNYGTFDFDDPSFYSKFTRGKLLYFVSVDSFQNFLEEYKYEKRGITEQVLNLSCSEKEKLVSALRENAKEENKYYKYDFIYDNCTTRLRDIVFKNANAQIVTKDVRPSNKVTFRNLIHKYLNSSYQYWSEFGIDILLGEPLDKKMSNDESMFLPDYLLKGFDSTTINGNRLISEKKEILVPVLPANKKPFLSPFILFSILFLLIVALSVYKNTYRFLSVFDFILFFTTGLLGVFLLFMWFGTDHPECKNNFNLVWAFPFHIIIIFFLYKKRNWVRRYFLFNSILLLALLVFWKWLPQEMNNALLPLVCLLLLRSFIRHKHAG